MAKCLFKTLAHGHSDECQNDAVQPDGMCQDCHDRTSSETQELLEAEVREPLHLR